MSNMIERFPGYFSRHNLTNKQSIQMTEYKVKEVIRISTGPETTPSLKDIQPGASIWVECGKLLYHPDDGLPGKLISHTPSSAIENWLHYGRIVPISPTQQPLQSKQPMGQVIEFVVKQPIIVTQRLPDGSMTYGIPEGGALGFDGTLLYQKTVDGKWSALSTNKHAIVEWLTKKVIEKKTPVKKTHTIEALLEATKKIKEADLVKVPERPVEV